MVRSSVRAGCWPCAAHTATSSARTATEQRRMGRTPDRHRGDVRYCFRPPGRCNGNCEGFVRDGQTAVGKTCSVVVAGYVQKTWTELDVLSEPRPERSA